MYVYRYHDALAKVEYKPTICASLPGSVQKVSEQGALSRSPTCETQFEASPWFAWTVPRCCRATSPTRSAIAQLLTVAVFASLLAMTRLHVCRSEADFWSQVGEMRCPKSLCAALRSPRHRSLMLCDILSVRQAVTAAREVHRHSRSKADGIATWCGKKTMTFPVASKDLEHSQPPTAVSFFHRQFVPSSLCGCGGAYDTLTCCASLNVTSFFLLALSHALASSLRLLIRSRGDSRRELTELQPFNLTHVLADVPNGKDFNEVLQYTRASQ